MKTALFSPPLPEPCLQLLPHTALQFPVAFQFVYDASRATLWSIHCTPCLPWPCTRFSQAPTTMEAPSPWVSRPVGDPEFPLMRRSVRLGPACPQTLSLRATHLRKPSATESNSRVLRCHRLRYATVDGGLHRVRHRFGFRFATGSVFNFTIRTGLADATTLHTFRLLRFWPCYRPLKDFPFRVRPFVLEGLCFQPSPSMKVSHQRLDGAHSQPLLSLKGIQQAPMRRTNR